MPLLWCGKEGQTVPKKNETESKKKGTEPKKQTPVEPMQKQRPSLPAPLPQKESVASEKKKAPCEKKPVARAKTPAPPVPVDTAPRAPKPAPRAKKSASPVPVEPAVQGLPAAEAPVAAQPLVGAEHRRLLLRRLLVLLLLAAILVASVFVYLYRPTDVTSRRHSVRFLYEMASDITTVVVDGKVVGDPLPGLCVSYAYDGDGDTVAALVGGDLYLVRRGRVKLVARTVSDYTLSQNGAALAYRTEEGTLYYGKIGRNVKLSLIVGKASDRYCLSPNGKELFYAFSVEDAQRIGLYSRTNSAPGFAVTMGFVPVAVADHCESLYYRDTATGTLYYMNDKGESTVLCVGDVALCFNRDFSELLADTDTETLLWKKGEQVMLPTLEEGEHLRFLANARASLLAVTDATQYLVRSFLEGYYIRTGAEGSGAMLAYLDRKGGLQGVAFVNEARAGVTVTDQGVYYISTPVDDGQCYLYRCEIGSSEPERLSSTDVSRFKTSNGGDRLFYTDLHGALYTMKLGGTPERLHVSENISPDTICVSAGNFVYYTVGDTLWVSEDGKEPRPLRDVPAHVTTDAHTAYFTGKNPDGSHTVWASHRGGTETVIQEKCDVIK